MSLSPKPTAVFGASDTLVGLSPPRPSAGFEAEGTPKDKTGALDVDTAGVDVWKLKVGWAGFLLVNKLVNPEEDVTDAEVALGVWKLKPTDELDVVVENKPIDGVVLGFVVEVPNKPVELVAAGASVDPKSPPLTFLVEDPNKPPVDGAAAVVLAAGAPNKLLVVDDEVVCGFAGAPNKPPVLWFEGVDDDPNKPPLPVFFEAPKRPPPLGAVVLAGVPKLNKKYHCQY